MAPVLIEQTIQSELLQVGYAVLIGDQRKFLSVLLTLKVIELRFVFMHFIGLKDHWVLSDRLKSEADFIFAKSALII